MKSEFCIRLYKSSRIDWTYAGNEMKQKPVEVSIQVLMGVPLLS